MVDLIHVHGSHNHFYILDQTELNTPLVHDELVALAQKFCQKNAFWPGADGILVVDEPTHSGPVGKMTVVNADGSIASMCGNGLRTVTRYLSEKTGQKEFTVETAEADLRVAQAADFAKGVPAFSVEISPVLFNKEAFPFDNLGFDNIVNEKLPAINDHLSFTAIAVPNPHLISFVDSDQDLKETLGEIGQRLNGKNQYFPDGVNVNFAKILGPNKLFVRTFERGVGFTNACGTGMSATSFAFALIHPEMIDLSQSISVFNPGGMVKTNVHPNAEHPWIELIGNATFLDKVSLDESDLHQAKLEESNFTITKTNEETAYQAFVESL
ncbi:diaminopimelate epimerase [Fructobacillus sp. CRL 2054]|uniref:diaminopimelate epimerase n=1 Tax=Fructobacillus sp. CRL 2054 TaxID=2763007 RepID=UPI0023792E2F|nr:diaminopimelate epimerase [Fructobacillus sp. CRL 2054]MDD9138844.1 diaminopimelate epimerase [Fructobacillus sp. CRL 2054]